MADNSDQPGLPDESAASLGSHDPDADLAARFLTLTAREREVLELVAAARHNKEIAAALVVTVETVEAHVSHIMTKLGARSRTEAALAWLALAALQALPEASNRQERGKD